VGVASVARIGRVLTHQAGEKWSVELRLDEHDRCYSVFLNRTFITEMLANEAGTRAVADWTAGRVLARDLILQELAAVYRRLRATHKTMQPVTVPATRSAWEHALGAWEQSGWIRPSEAIRYRDHVRAAFEAETGPVRRHKLSTDGESAA
jgi:hypothetical protein